jgi:hypothetical protein
MLATIPFRIFYLPVSDQKAKKRNIKIYIIIISLIVYMGVKLGL